VNELLKQCQRHNMLAPWSDDARSKPANPIFADLTPRGTGDKTKFHATMDLRPGWEGWFTQWQRTWDSPAPDTIVITDEWAVEKGRGVIFHWTTSCPCGSRATASSSRAARHREITIPAGVEAQIEHLPLQDPRRTAVEQDRRDIIQFGWKLAETQPRLTLRQAGRCGTLHVAVRLILK